MRYVFQTDQWLPHPVERVFAFFADPANLPHLMPAWQSARIEEAVIVPPPPPPRAIPAAGIGTRLTLSFRPFPYSPIRIPWQAEITDFSWNERFCDLQLRGPFTYWLHCHSVQAASQNGIPGTNVTDHVEYELPLGPLGELAHRLVLRSQIARTFAHRQAMTAQFLAGIGT